MHGYGGTPTESSSGSGNGFSVFDTMDSRCQVVAERIFFFSPKHAHQDENSAAHSGIAKSYAFICGGDTKPAGTFLLESKRAGFRTMSIGVAFDNRTDLDSGSDMALKSAKIVA
jgi:hypothetical protein